MHNSSNSKLLPRALCLALALLLSACAPVRPYERSAKARVLPVQGPSVHGTVGFVERLDGLQVSYSFIGLRSQRYYSLQIAATGYCLVQHPKPQRFSVATQKIRASVSKRFDIRADKNGNASGFVVMRDMTLSGSRSLLTGIVTLWGQRQPPVSEQNHPVRLACGVIVE